MNPLLDQKDGRRGPFRRRLATFGSGPRRAAQSFGNGQFHQRGRADSFNRLADQKGLSHIAGTQECCNRAGMGLAVRSMPFGRRILIMDMIFDNYDTQMGLV